MSPCLELPPTAQHSFMLVAGECLEDMHGGKRVLVAVVSTTTTTTTTPAPLTDDNAIIDRPIIISTYGVKVKKVKFGYIIVRSKA